MAPSMILRGFTTAISMSVSISSIFDIYRIHCEKSTGLKSALPLIALGCNGHIWMWYGFLTSTYFPICVTAVFAQTCSVIFASIFYYYSDDRLRIRRMLYIALCLVIPIVLFVICTMSGATGLGATQAAHILGGIGDAFAIIMLGSPLEKIKVVIKTKSSRALPVPLCCMCLVNTSLWLSFGLTTGDVYVILPNCFGVVLCSLQVALCIIYRSSAGDAIVTDPTLVDTCTSEMEEGVSTVPSEGEYSLSMSSITIKSPKLCSFESEIVDYAALRSPSAAAFASIYAA